jgi:iron-sulfur cluster repair protein YtfE (RIC family)
MASNNGSEDAIALLKADHKKVKALFAEAKELGDRAYASRAKLFAQIDEELTIHTKVEEAIFYPAFKEKTKSASPERDEVLEAYEEHAGAKELIKKLEGLDPSDETYKAKLQVLGEEIDHHVKEEETTMFPMARKLLSEDELRALGDQIQEMKAQAGAPA